VPEIRKVTVDPDTVQTVVVLEEYTTARVEPAVAPRVNGVPTVCVPGFANVIVCGAFGVTELDAAEAAPVLPLLAVTVNV
jgi:hypothetical protein